MTNKLPWYLEPVKPIDQDAISRGETRQASLTKPPGSLGELERVAVRFCGMLGDSPVIRSPSVVVFAADHGVAADGVSAFPQAVTGEMVRNFSSGGAAISVLSRAQEARLEVVQLGTVNDPGDLPGVIRAIIAPCSGNLATEPAMTAEQVEMALTAGKDAVTRAAGKGADMLLPGDMGIGNTTAAAAMTCAYLDLPAEQVAGPGTGLDVDGVARKVAVITAALERHADYLDSPMAVLRILGGFEIAAMAGACIAAAQRGMPVLVDGFIASAAALAAIRLQPDTAGWLQLCHRSAEPGHTPLIEELSRVTGSRPLLDLGLRLGEGSGAAITLPLIRLACELHCRMATFEEAGVSGTRDEN